jgi:hypothetical protein
MNIYSGLEWNYLLKMVIFHSFLYVYQRLGPHGRSSQTSQVFIRLASHQLAQCWDTDGLGGR